jgi:dienelactone hydrolase
MHAMLRYLVRVLIIYTAVVMVLAAAAFADERPSGQTIQEEVWAIPVMLPTIAYVVRPVGKGPFPLVVMNHGVSMNQRERGFFPIVEFRDAAMWFARRGYMVVAPSGTGYGAAALDDPERGLYSLFFSKVGGCDNPNFRDAGRAVALIDKWIIEYMSDQKLIVPDDVIVVGQSAGGWGCARSLHSPPAAAVASAASPTTIARPTDWSRRPVNSDTPLAPPCYGSTSRTTHSSARPYPSECTRPTLGPAETPNITCFPRSAMTDIFWSVRPIAFRCGRRWSGRSWTSTNRLTPASDGGER